MMPAPISSTRFFSAATVLCLSLLWLLPFSLPDHKVPVGTFWQEWVAASLLLSATFFALMSSAAALCVGIPHIVRAPLGLAAVIAVQWATGLLGWPAQFIIPALYLLLAALAGMTGASLAQSGSLEKTCTGIALACLIGGIFNVNIQIGQLLQLENAFPFMSVLLPGQRPFGNINQSNHLAAYLGMSLSSVLYLRYSGRLSMLNSWSVITILIAGLALTGQRSAAVYVCTPLIVTLLAWRSLPGHRSTLLKAGLILPVLFGLMNPLIKYLHESTALPLEMMVSKPLYSNRWDFWQHTWRMFSTHPLLGVGFDQFWPVFFEQIDYLKASAEAPTHPHNLIAALLAETGIVGTLAVFVPIGIWLWRSRLAAVSLMQWLALIQILIIGFHSMIEYPLWYSYFLIPFAFWLGATDPSVHALVLHAPRRIAAVFLLTVAWPLTDIATSYRKFRSIVWSVPHARIMDIPTFKAAHPQALADLTHHWFFQRLVAFWLPDLHVIDPKHAAEDIALNRQAMNVAPSSSILFRQVLLLVHSGQVDEAVRLLHRARLIFPERYREMRPALITATKQWPQQFGPVLDRLLSEPDTH